MSLCPGAEATQIWSDTQITLIALPLQSQLHHGCLLPVLASISFKTNPTQINHIVDASISVSNLDIPEADDDAIPMESHSQSCKTSLLVCLTFKYLELTNYEIKTKAVKLGSSEPFVSAVTIHWLWSWAKTGRWLPVPWEILEIVHSHNIASFPFIWSSVTSS